MSPSPQPPSGRRAIYSITSSGSTAPTSRKRIREAALHPLEEVQVREALERAHALRVRAHDLLVVKQHPLVTNAHVRDVMPRVHRGSLMADERLQAEARGARRRARALRLHGRG
jgi:hypothetical protein